MSNRKVSSAVQAQLDSLVAGDIFTFTPEDALGETSTVTVLENLQDGSIVLSFAADCPCVRPREENPWLPNESCGLSNETKTTFNRFLWIPDTVCVVKGGGKSEAEKYQKLRKLAEDKQSAVDICFSLLEKADQQLPDILLAAQAYEYFQVVVESTMRPANVAVIAPEIMRTLPSAAGHVFLAKLMSVFYLAGIEAGKIEKSPPIKTTPHPIATQTLQ